MYLIELPQPANLHIRLIRTRHHPVISEWSPSWIQCPIRSVLISQEKVKSQLVPMSASSLQLNRSQLLDSTLSPSTATKLLMCLCWFWLIHFMWKKAVYFYSSDYPFLHLLTLLSKPPLIIIRSPSSTALSLCDTRRCTLWNACPSISSATIIASTQIEWSAVRESPD